MKFTRIFANDDRLFAVCHSKGDAFGELIESWNDVLFIKQFCEANYADFPKGYDLAKAVNQILNEAHDLEECLKFFKDKPDLHLSKLFKSLDNQEIGQVDLSLRKAKSESHRPNFLRIYAVKVGENTHIITGGAIKFHHFMRDRDHTQRELQKLNQCRDYLKSEGIIDEIGFKSLEEE